MRCAGFVCNITLDFFVLYMKLLFVFQWISSRPEPSNHSGHLEPSISSLRGHYFSEGQEKRTTNFPTREESRFRSLWHNNFDQEEDDGSEEDGPVGIDL